MQLNSRNFALSLLLALVVSYAAASAHAATHVSGEALDCELCSTYSSFSDGVITDADNLLPSFACAIVCEQPSDLTVSATLYATCARGPPSDRKMNS